MRSVLLLAVTIVCTAIFANVAQAQYIPPNNNPFQNILNRPTVSPYLNLINPNGGDFASSVGRYQNFVRPQLELQQRNAATDRRLSGIQNQLNQYQQNQSTALRSDPMSAAPRSEFATGHPSVFQYYSHFYRLGR